jgi:hypothetical protein
MPALTQLKDRIEPAADAGAVVQVLNWIGGTHAPARLRIVDRRSRAATGRIHAQVPDSDERDVDRAVSAAEKAFRHGWALGREGRAKILLRIADRLERDLERFAQAESRDTGKPVALAREVDIPRAVANLRFFATAAIHFSSEAHLTDEYRGELDRSPAGGCGGLHQPMEPAALPVHLEDRPCDGGRMHGGGETQRGHPHDRLPFFGDLRRRKDCPPAC